MRSIKPKDIDNAIDAVEKLQSNIYMEADFIIMAHKDNVIDKTNQYAELKEAMQKVKTALNSLNKVKKLLEKHESRHG